MTIAENKHGRAPKSDTSGRPGSWSGPAQFIPYYPFWALTVITLDVFVI